MEKRLILLVEDEKLIRELYTIMLTTYGYLVDEAEDGEIALSKALQQEYDLILLDIMLPKVTGVEVLRKVRSSDEYKSKSSPVIVITNMGDEGIINEMVKMGIEKYILKAELNNNQFVEEINSFFQLKEGKS
jgi:two-component system response regulator ResD